MTSHTNNMRGAALMVASMACFTFGDAFMKALGEAMPLSQILTLRGFVSTAFIAVLAWRLGGFSQPVPKGEGWKITLRALADVAAAFFFMTALFNMDFANVSALLQMLPLTITLGSAVFFSEPVGWRRWSAIAVGFLGMLLIVQPGSSGFTIYSIYALGAVASVTVRDLITRTLDPRVNSMFVTFINALGVLVFALLWAPFQTWEPVTGQSLWLLAGASVFIVGAYSFSVLVMRVGDVGFVAPFRYTSLVLALLLGLLVFDEWPNTLALCGAGLIVGTGLFTLWREMRLPR